MHVGYDEKLRARKKWRPRITFAEAKKIRAFPRVQAHAALATT
jgi:hypothetical protein